METHLFCFGFGFCAKKLAEALKSQGVHVSGTCRTKDKQTAASVPLHLFNSEDGPPLEGAEALLAPVTHLLISAPPTEAGDPALVHHRDALLAAKNLKWVGLLSTTGVYGDSNGEWVDETTPATPMHARGQRRVAAEQAWLAFGEQAQVPVRVFRLSGIYGPGEGRNALSRIRSKTARRIVKPGHVSNRIHVDDIVTTLRASMARPEVGQDHPIFNVTDDEPQPPDLVMAYAAELLGVEPPPEIPFDHPSLPPFVKSFYAGTMRVKNRRIREELGVQLAYPNILKGLEAMHRVGDYG